MSIINHNPKTHKVLVEIEDNGLASPQSLRQSVNIPPALNGGMLPSYNPLAQRRLRQKGKKKKATLFTIRDGGYLGNGVNLPFIYGITSGNRAAYEDAAKDNFTTLFDLPFLPDSIKLSDYYLLVNTILSTGLDNFLDVSTILDEYRADYPETNYFPRPFADAIVACGDKFYYMLGSYLEPDNPNYSEKWTTSGLQLSNEDLEAGVIIYIGGNVLDLRPGGSKITTVLDIDAPSVSFTPSKTLELTYLPQLQVYQAVSQKLRYVGGVENHVFQWSPAQLLSDRRSVYYRDSPVFDKFYTGSWVAFSSNWGGDLFYKSAYDGATTAPLVGINTGGIISDSGTFPPPPGDPYEFYDGKVYISLRVSGQVGYYGIDFPEHYPVAIIRQNNELFYIWV